jgi:hypothetical protein
VSTTTAKLFKIGSESSEEVVEGVILYFKETNKYKQCPTISFFYSELGLQRDAMVQIYLLNLPLIPVKLGGTMRRMFKMLMEMGGRNMFKREGCEAYY